MTAVIGQEGSTDAGTRLDQPDDPMHHLAVLLGIMAGDKYQSPQDGTGFNADDLKGRQAKAVPAATVDGRPDSLKNVGGVLGAAQKYMGVKYVYGGNDPVNGLDCSSFVQRAFADIGIALPRVTYDQVKMGYGVGRNDLQPGDLLFFVGDGNRTNGHVGIYAGNGVMLDEPHTGSSVGYHQINWDRVTAMRRVT